MTPAEPRHPTVDYVQGHALLDGRIVVVTAAAGAGIGVSTAKRCLEEAARAVVIGDIHQRRLGEVTEKLRAAGSTTDVPGYPAALAG